MRDVAERAGVAAGMTARDGDVPGLLLELIDVDSQNPLLAAGAAGLSAGGPITTLQRYRDW